MLILGIETACDDTAAALVDDGVRVLSNVILSQDSLHESYGGVVPEISARRQVEVLNQVVDTALRNARIPLTDVKAVAVNNQHGLLRSLVVGVAAAKSLAYALQVPLIAVHHIEAHIFANFIEDPELPVPHLCLTVAGGHSLIVKVLDQRKYELVGSTRDDSAGETFDKVARYLGLGFPGGRRIQELATGGNPDAFTFPRPLARENTSDLSFSGLKESARRKINEIRQARGRFPLRDFCASFQAAVVDSLVTKSLAAAKNEDVQLITLAGGVAANLRLRETLKARALEHGIHVRAPSLRLCLDNGATIAGLGFFKLQQEGPAVLELGAVPNAPLGGHIYY